MLYLCAILILINLTQLAIGQFGQALVMYRGKIIPVLVVIVVVIYKMVKMREVKVKRTWIKPKTKISKKKQVFMIALDNVLEKDVNFE